jgi:cytochrome c peroxidase
MPRSPLSSLAALALLAGCRAGPPAQAVPGRPDAPAAWETDNPLRPLPEPPLGSPADFAALPWVTPAKVRLGRWLFFDPRLSADGTIACATCHQPERGFSEPTSHSTGIRGQQGTRKAPPIVNAAFPVYPAWFWDGRAASLAEQAKGPIENPVEMGNTLAAAVATVSRVAGYRRHFREAFGDDRVDIDRLAEAIAAYEATRLSGNSRADRFDAGDATALSEAERRGRALFFGRAACSTCHLGPAWSDGQFHNVGVGWRPPPPGAPPERGFVDLGRAAVSRDPRDTGAFKTPTLRDCARRAPYMHDGSVGTLREAVDLYRSNGTANPWLSPKLRTGHLSPADVDDLTAFLGALDGEGFSDEAPRHFPR